MGAMPDPTNHGGDAGRGPRLVHKCQDDDQSLAEALAANLDCFKFGARNESIILPPEYFTADYNEAQTLTLSDYKLLRQNGNSGPLVDVSLLCSVQEALTSHLNKAIHTSN
ncbi:hypothetical protein PGTUg99_008321 [Puccinia graminis f. sp. tritici]|uniref:Uncharacterized protein n=1 Tax=Puccinia graminis f. sp. tritici TaxID=56615 RepID=A0A5B0M4N0_PUCGR|nr:hypothetical protein PGTUg99_008321 [Puccinia graminis f. sp. tritici]